MRLLPRCITLGLFNVFIFEGAATKSDALCDWQIWLRADGTELIGGPAVDTDAVSDG